MQVNILIMDLQSKITEIRERVKQIDAEQEKLRDERRKCIIKAKRLEATLEHVNQILDEKSNEVATDDILR